MDLDLKGRAFLITGGTDGLGLALAQTLLDEGARVAVCSRDATRLASAQETLGPDALCVECDVTNTTQLDEFYDVARTRFGRVDGVVNNAGQTAASPVATSTDEAWRTDYELKVVAALHLSRLALDDLEVTGGSIINVLAILARTPPANSGPTSASRAAGLAMTKALANEMGPRGVRVNALLIGLIESGQWVRRAAAAGRALPDFLADMATGAGIPLGRIGRADEFANVAAFLLSPRASYLTGVGLNVDGGLSRVI